MSYKDLGIWQESRELVVLVHRVTVERLPKFEMYEEGSQIRRSMKSTKSNIVEGYGRRRYKQDYLRFLVYAHASCDETKDHWETLFETGSLQDEPLYRQVHSRLEELSKSIHRFIQAVEREHRSVREEHAEYTVDTQ
jgi:four helix bundle protein